MTITKKITRVRGWTLEEAEEQLDLWKKCLAAISTGQSYRIGSRSLTRADKDDALEMVEYFGKILEDFETGNLSRITVRQAVPFDG